MAKPILSTHTKKGHRWLHGEGINKTPEYRAYQRARKCCKNPKHEHFKYYGGRGIEFRFESYTAFLTELGRRPTPKHSVDRIDVNGHYEPGNVRWATRREQDLNKRLTTMVTLADGVRMPLMLAAEKFGIHHVTVRTRRKYGWCDDCCVKLPVELGRRKTRCVHRENNQ